MSLSPGSDTLIPTSYPISTANLTYAVHLVLRDIRKQFVDAFQLQLLCTSAGSTSRLTLAWNHQTLSPPHRCTKWCQPRKLTCILNYVRSKLLLRFLPQSFLQQAQKLPTTLGGYDWAQQFAITKRVCASLVNLDRTCFMAEFSPRLDRRCRPAILVGRKSISDGRDAVLPRKPLPRDASVSSKSSTEASALHNVRCAQSSSSLIGSGFYLTSYF